MRAKRAGADVIATLVDKFAKALQQAIRLHAIGVHRQAIVQTLASAQEIIGAIHVEMRVQGFHDAGSDAETLATMQAWLEATERTLTASMNGNIAAD